jgi:hypothetical protein
MNTEKSGMITCKEWKTEKEALNLHEGEKQEARERDGGSGIGDTK